MATDANAELADSPAGKSALERFLDNFLRESSIKWMLMIGAAIVESSSLMLVTEKSPRRNLCGTTSRKREGRDSGAREGTAKTEYPLRP